MVGLTQNSAGTIVITVVGVLVAAAQADTIYVDDDCPGPGDGSELDPYCSIQTAIDNAVDTDEIVVAPGSYFETIDFLGKAVTLRSSDGPDVTVIDAAGLNDSVIKCVTREGPGTVLDGFLITGGSAEEGGGLRNSNSSLLWGDSPDEIVDAAGAVTTVLYSDVQGGYPGLGNIDADPLFVDPDNSDLRLSAGSPCIDAGHNNAIAGVAGTDLDGNPRFADDPATTDTGCGVPVIVDMGAYEYQGDPAEVVFADLNADGFVGIADLMILIGCIGSDDPDCCIADLNLDGEVGMSDRLLAQASISIEFSPVR